MPLSQARFIALINAALDFKQAAERTMQSIQEAYQNFSAGRGTPEEHFHTLMSFTSLDTMLQRKESLAVLAVEYHHFRRNARRNDRAAIKSAAKRRQAGAIPRATTIRELMLRETPALPNALAPPSYIMSSLPIEDRVRILTDEVQTERYLDKPVPIPMLDRSPDPFLPPTQADDPFSGLCPICSQLIDDCPKPQCEWLTLQKVPEGPSNV